MPLTASDRGDPVVGLYVGAPTVLEPEGQRTGIFKQPVTTVAVTAAGCAGDHQVDRRYHGGPDKALHQFARASYAAIAERFPALAERAAPGTIGENLSTTVLDDDTVCIGDIYRCGGAVLQVSQPRRPCWKIDHRYDHPGIAAFVQTAARTGWYLRVLNPGRIELGDAMVLEDRPNPDWTVAALNRLNNAHRPPPDKLIAAAAATGLAPDWAQRLAARGERLTRYRR